MNEMTKAVLEYLTGLEEFNDFYMIARGYLREADGDKKVALLALAQWFKSYVVEQRTVSEDALVESLVESALRHVSWGDIARGFLAELQ